MPRNEGRTGQGSITHRPEQNTARTGHRPLAGTQTPRHLTGAHALEANRLVFHDQVQQHMLLRAKFPHRLRPPSGEAVGIQGDPQSLRQTFFVQRRHQALQITFKQADLLHMVEQTPADLGRRRRRCPYKHRLADACFEQLDALGNRRLRQPQHLCRPFKPGLLDHRGQGRKQFIVEHQFS
ncbi:hypothetical protein D3C81_1504910 [compost metagenome]